jgi:hypothetical protein
MTTMRRNLVFVREVTAGFVSFGSDAERSGNAGLARREVLVESVM